MSFLALCGSLRLGSLNKKVLKVAVGAAEKEGATVETLDLREFQLPYYDGDIEAGPGIPELAKKLAEKIAASQGLIIACPEYNHGYPGHFKNTIDWISRIRPVPFSRKPIVLFSASPGMAGGTRSQWALRVPLELLGSYVYPDMFSLGLADDAFDDKDQFVDPKNAARVGKLVHGYLDFAKKLSQ